MKKNQFGTQIMLIILGAVLLIVGIVVIDESSKTVSGLCVGIGAGLIGMNIANLLIDLYYRKHPEIKKQVDIDARDERSLAITCKAKAKAFDITVILLIVVPFLLILAGSPLWVILATIGVYLFGFCAQIYFTIQLGKEM
jgi:uncharacterized Tic20 family protein